MPDTAGHLIASTLIVITTLPDFTQAQTIARNLVERRLVACVNLLPGACSIYRWRGNIEQSTECMALMKTNTARYAELEAALRALHPYELPEILALPLTAGLPGYLQWVSEETSPPEPSS